MNLEKLTAVLKEADDIANALLSTPDHKDSPVIGAIRSRVGNALELLPLHGAHLEQVAKAAAEAKLLEDFKASQAAAPAAPAPDSTAPPAPGAEKEQKETKATKPAMAATGGNPTVAA